MRIVIEDEVRTDKVLSVTILTGLLTKILDECDLKTKDALCNQIIYLFTGMKENLTNEKD